MLNTKYKLGSDDYLIEVADYCIGDLVIEKDHLIKAYNYYSGKRDYYQYEHLEKNYGIGNPTSITFTPLIKKHIDALVGEFLTTKIQPKISCKDEGTLTNIFRDKQLALTKKNLEWVQKFLTNAVYEAIMGKQQKDKQTVDAEIDRELQRIKEDVDLNFISNYEIAGQDIVEYILQARKMDFKNKMQRILLDLLIAGEAYYKVIPTHDGTNFKIEIEDPLNVFTDKDPKSPYIKNSYKAVVRKWMTKEEILIKYGDELSNEDIKSLQDMDIDHYDLNNGHYIVIQSLGSRCGDYRNAGLLDGTGVYPMNKTGYPEKWDMIPVYEVEWIDYEKQKNGKIKGNRYEVVRIGSEIYILRGEDKNLVRDMDATNEVRLQLNGMYYTDGLGAPYSLMLATTSLQDDYDLINFYKSNILALSGTKGAHVDLAALPAELGKTLEERLMKYMAYRKSGLAVFDSAQDGSNTYNQNTYFGGFNDTIDVGSMQAVQICLTMIEDMASSITGVFRERLGGIQQRDAVANVEVGMQQSFIITKQYYQAMDTLVSEILTDALNLARRVYKKGLTGQLILGDKKEIFTLLPEHYCQTDFDVHLADSADIIKEQQELRALAIQLAQGGAVDIDIIVDIQTSKSYTEMRDKIRKSIHEKKLENNQIQQLSQQLQEAQQQVKQMQQQLDQTTRKLATLNEKALNIEQQNNVAEQQIKWYKVKSDADAKEKELELIKEKNKLEALQALDSNPMNDEIDDKKY